MATLWSIDRGYQLFQTMLGGGKGLASHHIQSFDAMCSRTNIQAIFDAETRRCKTDDGRFRVALTNPMWTRPTMPGLSLDLTAGCDESEVTDLRSPAMIGRTYDARIFADPVVSVTHDHRIA